MGLLFSTSEKEGPDPDEVVMIKILNKRNNRGSDFPYVHLKQTEHQEEVAWKLVIHENGITSLTNTIPESEMYNLGGNVIRSNEMLVKIEGSMIPFGNYELVFNCEETELSKRNKIDIIKCNFLVHSNGKTTDFGIYDVA